MRRLIDVAHEDEGGAGMTDTVRVGVVGLGLWGQNHALSFADYHRSDLVAVCDLDAQRAMQYATTYGCKAVTDYRELAADPTSHFYHLLQTGLEEVRV